MQILFFFLNIILILNLIILTKEEGDCNYSDCFNCVICSKKDGSSCECKWNNNECKSDTTRNITYSILSSSCKNDNSTELMNKLCGQTTLKLNDDNIAEINIPPIKNSKYGMKNLHCSYIYSSAYDKDIYHIISYNPTSNNFENIQIYLSISFNDNDSAITMLSKFPFSSSFDNIKSIVLMVFFDDSLNSIPFTFLIEEKKFKTKLVIIITIVLIILFIIICSCFIYTLSKKIKERRMPSLPLATNRYTRRRIIIINENNEEETKKKIENLIKNSLSSQIYNEKIEIKDKCSICLEEFKVGKDKVSITPCNHIFHYNCLSKWLLENYQLPKCPNCNYNIVEYFENIESPKKLALNRNMRVNIEETNSAVSSNENINITNHNNDNNRNDRRNGSSNNNNNQENH